MSVPNIYLNVDVDENKAVVKAARTRVCKLHVSNPDSSDFAYLKFFDGLTADVTVGTTVPVVVFGVPANTAVIIDMPCEMENGLVIAAVAAAANNSSTAPTTGLVVTLTYT